MLFSFLLFSTAVLTAAQNTRDISGRPYAFDSYNYEPPTPIFLHDNENPTPTMTTMNIPERQSDRNSCKDQCHRSGHDSKLPCQCNKKCLEHNDCCKDYGEECLSCDQRCHFSYVKNFPCQCNSKCGKFNNCCRDYLNVCKAPGNETVTADINRPQNEQPRPPPQRPNQSQSRPDENTNSRVPVSDNELAAFSEDIFGLEGPNNAANYVRFNAQNRTTFGSNVDKSSLPLLTVNQAAYQRPTIAKLLALHNNYVPSVSAAEVLTTQESAEETQFLDLILATPIMKKAEKLLIDKGYISNQRRVNGKLRVNNRAFRDAFYQIWFGFYSRDNGALGSSGFEHIFLGETKAGQVSGFHNWVFFSTEEAKNNLNYYGHIRILNLGPKGSIIKHNFKWIEHQKPVSTMFIGTSPEFEMALYTVCFYVRSGTKCPVVIHGKHFNIQTHFLQRGGKRYIASGYPDI